MKILIEKDYTSLSKKAAEILGDVIKHKPHSVLGLATGSTPLGTYQELIRMNQNGDLDFSKVKTFNLDEYCGLKKTDPQSYHYYMWENFFRHINVHPDNVFIPNGNSDNPAGECGRYEQLINFHGGIDIQLLGIGRNGHIGFNEPDEKLVLDTYVVKLSQDTVEANSRFFSSEEDVPKSAITMGIGSIMKAKKILLLASGKGKMDVMKKILKERIITPEIPASVLHLHQDVTVILDFEV